MELVVIELDSVRLGFDGPAFPVGTFESTTCAPSTLKSPEEVDVGGLEGLFLKVVINRASNTTNIRITVLRNGMLVSERRNLRL